MKINYIKALWGMEGTLEEQFAKIAAAGYEGIESGAPSLEQEGQFKELLEKYKLDYIGMVFTSGTDSDSHLASFEKQMEQLSQFKPLFINSHSVKDAMPYEQQLSFFERSIAIEKAVGLKVGHETHRGRAMFTPWGTAQLLRDLPELKITADFSHWVCVCERLPHDQEEALELAISRTLHIHGRVGYAQGPQVPDPAAPEYSAELEAHLAWWQRICDEQSKLGRTEITFTPEFGPPGYMHTLPYTQQPVADLWKVCLWMRDKAKSSLR